MGPSLDQLFTPTPRHEMDADPIFQEMNHSHLDAERPPPTPNYYTPKRNEPSTTPYAPGASIATPAYFLDDSATPSYFYDQDRGQAAPPYFCDSPQIHGSDEILPPVVPDAGIELPDSGLYGCDTPRAYEDEQEEAQAEVALVGDEVQVETQIQDEPQTSPPEEPKVISNLQPVVLKSVQVKKKSKKADSEADITCTVEGAVEVITWSWFMNLPLEVRNRIYNYYFFPEGKDWAPRSTFGLNNTWRMSPPALLQSDPYIRKEAIAIYYRELKVSVASPEHDLVPWLETLDQKARVALQDITIAYDDEDPKRMAKPQKKSRCIDRCCKVLEKKKVRMKRSAFTGVYMGGGNWL